MSPLRWITGIKINQVVRFLTFSDIMILSGWGLVNPILAIFLADQIIGGDVKLAGLAVTVYFVTKSIVQIPVARFIDLRKGETDDFWAMISGYLLITAAAFLYSLATLPWHVYAIQVVYGIGGALAYPSWLAIFTRHIDKHEEGLEWSLYYTATDLVAAATAGIGGYLASSLGYQYLFIIVGFASLLGTAALAGLTRKLRKST